MFLTRLGTNSKAVINGDVTQVDLPPGRISGLVEAQAVVAAIEGIRFVYFDESDVVRHHLVQSIIKAYEAYRNGHQPEPEASPAPRKPHAARRGPRPPADPAKRD